MGVDFEEFRDEREALGDVICNEANGVRFEILGGNKLSY
jgi:hypothetical protein